MKRAILALSLALFAAGCAAFHGPVSGGTVSVVGPYVRHCLACHSADGGAPLLLSPDWRYRLGGSADRMGRMLDHYLGERQPAYGHPLPAVPWNPEEASAIRRSLVCHHFLDSAGCRRKDTP